MKIIKNERLCWLFSMAAVLIISWMSYHHEQTKVERYKFLAEASNLEHKILIGEIREYRRDAAEASAEGYRRGHTDGATYMGVAMMNDNESFVNYSDGYHAALHQYSYQTAGLSVDSSKVNSKLASFEKLLDEKKFDSAATELTAIILSLEDRLEAVFMEAVAEPPPVEEDTELPKEPRPDSDLTPAELKERILDRERDRAIEARLFEELEDDLKFLNQSFDVKEE